jgi:hypothetical protein
METYPEIFRVVNFIIDTRKFASKFVLKSKLNFGVSTYFTIVIGQTILRKESVKLA